MANEPLRSAADGPRVLLSDGESWPAIGLGTWRMGESRGARDREVAAVREAIGMGYRLIDTAEMYGDGGAETIVGAAIAAAIADGVVTRDQLVVVSKVYPHHASAAGVRSACGRSLERLGLDRLDAYLLHWPGAVPLVDTVTGFEALRAEGRIRHWGVSNFDVDDITALFAVPSGDRCAINQIYYSLGARGPAFALLPWHLAHGVATMAYSPIDQGRLAASTGPEAVAARHGASVAQVALAWLARQSGVTSIPKAVSVPHLRENLAAAAILLDDDDLAAIDRAFPPPRRKTPLATT